MTFRNTESFRPATHTQSLLHWQEHNLALAAFSTITRSFVIQLTQYLAKAGCTMSHYSALINLIPSPTTPSSVTQHLHPAPSPDSPMAFHIPTPSPHIPPPLTARFASHFTPRSTSLFSPLQEDFGWTHNLWQVRESFTGLACHAHCA